MIALEYKFSAALILSVVVFAAPAGAQQCQQTPECASIDKKASAKIEEIARTISGGRGMVDPASKAYCGYKIAAEGVEYCAQSYERRGLNSCAAEMRRAIPQFNAMAANAAQTAKDVSSIRNKCRWEG
jgi:hypothetical protein